MIENLTYVLPVIIAFGIFNVWLLRYKKPTEYRAGNAKNLEEEFKNYGLPTWSVKVIGALKLSLALLLLVGIVIPELLLPASLALAALMLGAVAMHIKVKDPIKKSLPALVMLALCLIQSALMIY